MNIAIIQSNPVNGDIRGNMRTLERLALQAAEQGVELCVAPELSLSGPDVGDLFADTAFLQACRQTLEEAARRLDASDETAPALLLGAPLADPPSGGARAVNAAVLLYQGKVSVLGGSLTGSAGITGREASFAPAKNVGLLTCKGSRLAVFVGTDIFALDVAQSADGGAARAVGTPVSVPEQADGIIALTALPFVQGLPERNRRILSGISSGCGLPLVFANMAGGHDSLVCYGGSFATDRQGNATLLGPEFVETLLLARTEGGKGQEKHCPLRGEEELWQAIVQGTRDYAAKNGFTAAVVGLSGGVDSSLVAAVAAESFGPEQVTGLLMPSPYSSSGSIDDALLVAGNLGIGKHVLPVTPVLREIEAVFDQEFPGSFSGLAKENTQARIRSTYVMAFANRFGALALATGNKSEAAAGYATLYGDLTGGLAPIGDIYKHQVYALCRLYNEKHPDAIPSSVLTKAPSAELRPGQKDSDSLPPYEELDPLLFDIIENGRSLPQLVEKGYARETALEVLRMVQRAEFKRRQGPPCLRLSSRGFAGGWSYPITLGEWYA
jgi:NAD+ synthase (glutamine-hydrolysing)